MDESASVMPKIRQANGQARPIESCASYQPVGSLRKTVIVRSSTAR